MYFPDLESCPTELAGARAFVQAILARRDLDDPCDIGMVRQLLHDLKNLPDAKPRSKIEVTITRTFESGSLESWSVSLFPSRFEIKSGGYIRTEGRGGDSVAGFNFSAEKGCGALRMGEDSWAVMTASCEEERSHILQTTHYQPLEHWSQAAVEAASDPTSTVALDWY